MKVSVCSPRPILSPCTLNNFDYQVDPYIGCEHYCYYCYALRQAETDWQQEILVHENMAARLGEELDAIVPQKIYMGYTTDPYQPCEADYGQTRKVLELLLEKGFSASILTKSDLVVRDADLLKEMVGANVSVSVAFNDDPTRRLFEAGTIDSEKRIAALHRIRDAGVPTAALICPVIPHITDVFPLVESLAPVTDRIWIYGLSIENPSDQNWKNVKEILERHYASQQQEITSAVFSKDHPYWAGLREKLQEIKDKNGIPLNIHL